MALYQNKKNGQMVEFISHHDKEWAMVKNSQGQVQYVALKDLESYEPGKGRTGHTPPTQLTAKEADPDVIPETIIPMDTRLNMNMATAEAIAKQVKGIGYATAKRIVELRMSLPGERFKDLDQLRKVGRVDWDQVIQDDLIFIG